MSSDGLRFTLCLAILGCFAWRNFAPRYLEASFTPSAQASDAAVDPCANKERCVVVQVAPWCPVCHRAAGTIQALRDHWKDSSKIGFKIVVAGDTLDKLKETAASLGPNTYIDPEGVFSHQTGFKAYPTWVVLNQDKKVVGHIKGTYEGAPADMIQKALIKDLGLQQFET